MFSSHYYCSFGIYFSPSLVTRIMNTGWPKKVTWPSFIFFNVMLNWTFVSSAKKKRNLCRITDSVGRTSGNCLESSVRCNGSSGVKRLLLSLQPLIWSWIKYIENDDVPTERISYRRKWFNYQGIKRCRCTSVLPSVERMHWPCQFLVDLAEYKGFISKGTKSTFWI